jgi:ornithine cyclodeaminase
LPFARLIAAIEEGFRSECDVPLRHHHHMKNDTEEDAVLLLMPAWQARGYGGVKLVNVVPGNSARGRAAISASYVLFDRQTGEHLLILDGGELTARRTAAASALAARKVARPDSRHLLLVGAGRVGSNIPHAYRSVLPIDTVRVFNRDREKAAALAAGLRKDGIDADVAEDLEAACKSADIITCATLSQEPVLRGAWLRPGQHVDLIGSFTPHMREADDEVMRRGTVFLDTGHAKIESGDIALPLKSGALRETDIAGTLFDLCRNGAHERTGDDEITVFKSVGSAIEDLAAAILAYESVRHGNG